MSKTRRQVAQIHPNVPKHRGDISFPTSANRRETLASKGTYSWATKRPSPNPAYVFLYVLALEFWEKRCMSGRCAHAWYRLCLNP